MYKIILSITTCLVLSYYKQTNIKYEVSARHVEDIINEDFNKYGSEPDGDIDKEALVQSPPVRNNISYEVSARQNEVNLKENNDAFADTFADKRENIDTYKHKNDVADDDDDDEVFVRIKRSPYATPHALPRGGRGGYRSYRGSGGSGSTGNSCLICGIVLGTLIAIALFIGAIFMCYKCGCFCCCPNT